jgi:hypothetical protein
MELLLMEHMDISCMQIVLGNNIDTIKKAAGSLITEENKAKYTEVGIFQLLSLQHFFPPICALIKVFNVTY